MRSKRLTPPGANAEAEEEKAARAARVEGLSEEQAAAEEAARKEAEATIAVAEALTLLEKGAARAELREMAPVR